MNPPPHQWERDERRHDAAPHDQPVRESALISAAEYESVQRKFDEEAAEQRKEVMADVPRVGEHLPASTPVQPRGRTMQPHRVAIGDAEGRKEGGERVTDERCVEVLEVARPGDDQAHEETADEQPPRSRSHPLASRVPHRPIATLLRTARQSNVYRGAASQEIFSRREIFRIDSTYGRDAYRDPSKCARKRGEARRIPWYLRCTDARQNA